MPGGHAIPYQSFPDVNPTGAPSNDLEQIHTSPEMFGGFLAQGEQKLGSGLETADTDATDAIVQRQRLDNQVHGSELHSWFSNQASDLVSKFSQLQGKAALEQLPDFKKQVQDLQTQAEGQAGSPELKSLVAVNTRRTMDNYQDWMTRHADTQRQDWYTKTAKDNITSATGTGGLAILNNDYKTLDRQMDVIGAEAHNYYDPQGYDAPTLAVEVSKYKGNAVKNWVETAATNDKDPDNVGHALSIFERYSKDIDPQSRLDIAKYVNAKAQARSADRIADYYIGGSASGLSQRFVDAYGFFVERGYTPAQASGIAGGLRGETANLSPSQIHDGGIGLGISGWNADRLASLKNFAKASGGSPTDTLTQLEFVDHELRGPESAARARLMAAQTPEQAGQAMLTYFRPKDYDVSGAHPERAQYARQIYNAVNGTSPGMQIDADQVVNQIASDPLFKDRPELQKAVINNVMQKASIFNRAEAIKNRQFKEQSDGTELGIFKRIHGDDPNLSLQEIFNNLNLSKEATERLTKEYETRGGVTKTDHTYGTGFYDLYQRVHLPEGDPNRVTDQSQLYSHVGLNGDLTVGGVDKLVNEIQARKSPEGVAESEMKSQFLKNARAQITGSNEGLHMRDHKGDEQYLKFMAQALPAYDAGKRAGKSAAQLMDPDGPDYVGKIIKNFRRPDSEWFDDMIQDNAPGPENAAGKTPAPFNPNSIKTLDQAVAAYRSGHITKAQADQMAIANGWGFRKPPAPQVPMSQ